MKFSFDIRFEIKSKKAFRIYAKWKNLGASQIVRTQMHTLLKFMESFHLNSDLI